MALLTVHYHLHILDKAMDDLEDLRYCLSSLILSQPAQPLDHRLHFLLASELPNDFFFIHTVSPVINSLTNDKLTEFSLLRLFGRQRQCGEQLHEYLDNYFIHGFSGRDLGIDFEATEEVSDRMEQTGKGTVVI